MRPMCGFPARFTKRTFAVTLAALIVTLLLAQASYPTESTAAEGFAAERITNPGQVPGHVPGYRPGHVPGHGPGTLLGDNPEMLERVGSWQYGQALAVTVDQARSLVYLGSGGAVFVVDITDIADPVLVSDEIRTLGLVQDIAYDAATQRLFLACGESGLEIWDLSDPAAPARIVVFDVLYYGFSTPVENVEVLGDFALVECAWGFVHSIDVSDPENPVDVSFSGLMGNPARDIHLSSDGYLHSVGAQYYVRFSIDEEGVLHTAGSYSITYGGYLVFGTEEAAFVYASGYLYILDLVSHSGILSTISVGHNVNDIFVEGDSAYLTRLSEVAVFDVSDLSSPYQVGSISLPGGARKLEVVGSEAYVAGTSAGLRVLDVSVPSAPEEIGFYDTPNATVTMQRSGDHGYLALIDDGMLVLDLADVSDPTLVGQYDTPGSAYDISVEDGYAYVADWDSGLRIADVSDPANPVEVGFADVGQAYRVTVSSGYAYVVDNILNEPDWLRIVNVSDPAHPAEAGSLYMEDDVLALDLSGAYLYAATSDSGLRVIDVSNPDDPVEIGSYDAPDVLDVKVDGSLAYLASSDALGGFLTLDVSDPSAPTLLNTYRYGLGGFYPFDIAIEGAFAYITAPVSDLVIMLYLRDPENPVEVGTYEAAGDLYDISAQDSLVYISSGAAGLLILDNNLYYEPGAGVGWEEQVSGTEENLRCVHFLDAATGCVVGDGGTVLVTSDGGENWVPKTSGTGEDLFAVFFANETTGWLGGREGVISKTSDGGETWLPEASGTTEQIRSIQFVDVSLGWAVGGGGTVLKTVDGGATWEAESTGVTGTLNSVSFVDSQHGWAADLDDGQVLRTEDGGETWEALAVPTEGLPSCVCFIDPYVGWITTWDTEIFKTTDGGLNWVEQYADRETPYGSLNSVSCVDAEYAWVVGADGLFGQSRQTTDGGDTWTQMLGAHDHYLQSVWFVDRHDGWAVGHDGTILKAVQGPVDNVYAGLDNRDASDTGPTGIALRGNIPNPFTTSTKIRYELATGAEVTLSIYSVTGQQVRALVSAHQTPGEKTVVWDGRDDQGRLLGSGVFFCMLRAGDEMEIRKLLLLR